MGNLVKISQCTLVLLCLISSVFVGKTNASENLFLKTGYDSPVSVSAKLQHLKYLVLGGTTFAMSPPPQTVKYLKNFGFRKSRLIGYENTSDIAAGESEVFKFIPSKSLTRELTYCKMYYLEPHIIIGGYPPPSLSLTGEDNRVYGPSDWNLYDKYAQLFVEYISQDLKFKETYWEVGNEIGIPHSNWLTPIKLHRRLDPIGYEYYIKLFSHISTEFDEFQKAHPENTVLLGGPVTGFDNYNFGWEQNFMGRFITDVLEKNLKCDFVSGHLYGNSVSGSQYEDNVVKMRETMKAQGENIPIWVTEWGAYNYENENLNKPISGSFALSFLDLSSRLNIQETMFLKAKGTEARTGCSLFDFRGEPTYTMRAFENLVSLQGERVEHSSNSTSINCIPTRQGNNLTILFWNLDWYNKKLQDTYSDSLIPPQDFNIDKKRTGDESLISKIRNPDNVDLIITDVKNSKLKIMNYFRDGVLQATEKSLNLESAIIYDNNNAKLEGFSLPVGSFCRIDFVIY